MILTKRTSWRFICALFLAGLFLCALPHGAAQAQSSETDIFQRFRKPMPEIKLMSDEEFLRETKPVSKMPYNDRTLAYTVRIDKDWEEGVDRGSGNSVLNKKLFLELNSYWGTPTIAGRSYMEVLGLNLDNNLTAEQWYITYLLKDGQTPEGFKTHSDDIVESLTIVTDKDFSYYLRTLVLINGDKVLMVKYYVPVTFIKEEAAMQSMVVSSFALTNEIERVKQNMVVYHLMDIVEFEYPEGWKVFEKPLRGLDRLDVSLLNLKQIPGVEAVYNASLTEGRLDVRVVSSFVEGSLIDEVSRYKKEIEENGVLVEEKITEDYDFQYTEDIDFGIVDVYKGTDTGDTLSKYEIWFAVMVGGNYYYFLMMLTPSRNDSFAVWAENTENFKLILASFKPAVGAFLDRD